MTYTFKLSRRIARLERPCSPPSCSPRAVQHGRHPRPDRRGDRVTLQPASPDGTPAIAASYSGGMPIGITAQPNDAFGARYNGGLRNIFPST